MYPEFTVHKLNDSGLKKAEQVAHVFDDALDALIELWGADADPRLRSIVRTKLEEASFFAKKAVATAAENQL